MAAGSPCPEETLYLVTQEKSKDPRMVFFFLEIKQGNSSITAQASPFIRAGWDIRQASIVAL